MSGAWYVGRASWRRGWRALVFLGLLAGVVGGTVLGAWAGARRTSSAYDRLLHASGAPHEIMFLTAQDTEVQDWLRHTPSVARFAPAIGMIGRRAPRQEWYSLDAPVAEDSFGRPVLQRGRLADPTRADEVVLTSRAAENTGLDVGDEVHFRAYARGQTSQLTDDPWTVPEGADVTARVVGIARDPSDAQLSQTTKVMFGTPAFAQQFHNDTTFTLIGIWLKGGPRAAPQFDRELAQFARSLRTNTLPFSVISAKDDADAANQSARAVVTGLAIFALVAALAGIITVVQTTRRYLSRTDDERAVLVALGARRVDRAVAQLIGMLPYLALAPIVAVAIAFSMSFMFPVGATRALEPHPGLRADALVFAAGGLALLLALVALTGAVAWIGSAARTRPARRTPARIADGATGAGALPLSIGARFALGPGTRRRALHRAAVAGVVVSVIGVVGSIVFAASLDDMKQTPARYGLAFDLTVELPARRAQPVLDQLAAERDLAAVGAAWSATVDIEGRTINAYSVMPQKGSIGAVVSRGRLPVDASEIAIGPKLLDELHKHIGDDVTIASNNGTQRLKVVGTVFSPTSESSEFNGEVVLTRPALDVLGSNLYVDALARVRPGAHTHAVLANLDTRFPYGVSDESPARAPGPVRNLEQISSLPLVLAMFFALLGAAALAQALVMIAAERRRDLGILRALGFTRWQVTALNGAVATSVAALAIVLGVPLGVLAGKFGWSAVAENLYIAPAPLVPLAAITLLATGLLVFANLVAIVPARLLARRPPSTILRAE